MTELAEQIAFSLDRKGYELAFVVHQERLFYSYYPQHVDAPSSAVIKLIQGLFEIFHDDSFLILRHRLFSTAPLRERCNGMLKVGAKRASLVVPRELGVPLSFKTEMIGRPEDALIPPQEKQAWEIDSLLSFEKVKLEPSEVLNALETLRRQVETGPVRYQNHRQIAAALLGPDGQVLGAALNYNAQNKTRHAEVNLIQGYYHQHGRKLPRGSILYSTHKPCKMCAGMIHDWAEDPRELKVYYRHEETGGLSRNTALDRLGIQTQIS